MTKEFMSEDLPKPLDPHTEERTIVFPVPIYPDTDLSYRHKQVMDATHRVFFRTFMHDGYSYRLESLRGAPTYEADGQTYVKATVKATLPRYHSLLKLSQDLTEEAGKLA